MPEDRQHDGRRLFKFLALPPSNKFLQDNLDRGTPSILASYALNGAVIVFGGLGYLLDWYFDTAPWFLIGSLSMGITFGFYNLLRTTRQE